MTETLRQMAGVRNRCFYCCDSRSADVEHFEPISPYFRRTFSWENMLWICPECNRLKNNRFPTRDGVALLLNPAIDDPWRYLFLDTDTGFLAPRFENEDTVNERADWTLRVLSLLSDECVVEGRIRSIRRIRAAATACLVDRDDETDSVAELIRELREDDFGVAAWFTRWEGMREAPFAELRTARPLVWRRVVSAALSCEYGQNR